MTTTLLGTTAASDDSDAPREQYGSYALESVLHTSFTRQEPASPQSEFARAVADTSPGRSECDAGAIIRGAISSDMHFIYHYPELTIGTVFINSYYCTAYDRSTLFTITSLANITEFRLMQVSFDDHLLIKINGHKVYLGPENDGDRLEVTDGSRYGSITTNGRYNRACERATHWNFHTNIDLKPYLHEGENAIWSRVIVAGYGDAQMVRSVKDMEVKM